MSVAFQAREHILFLSSSPLSLDSLIQPKEGKQEESGTAGAGKEKSSLVTVVGRQNRLAFPFLDTGMLIKTEQTQALCWSLVARALPAAEARGADRREGVGRLPKARCQAADPGRQHGACKGLLGADCLGGRGCQSRCWAVSSEKGQKWSQLGRTLWSRGGNSKLAED